MLVRLALLYACVPVVVLGVVRLHDHDRCNSAQDAIVTALFHHREPSGGLAARQRELVASCHDETAIAGVSAVLTTAGRRGPALELARRATHDAPDAFLGWVALGQALERTDPRGAAVARARARALNPRGLVPRAAGAGAARPGA